MYEERNTRNFHLKTATIRRWQNLKIQLILVNFIKNNQRPQNVTKLVDPFVQGFFVGSFFEDVVEKYVNFEVVKVLEAGRPEMSVFCSLLL